MRPQLSQSVVALRLRELINLSQPPMCWATQLRVYYNHNPLTDFDLPVPSRVELGDSLTPTRTLSTPTSNFDSIGGHFVTLCNRNGSQRAL